MEKDNQRAEIVDLLLNKSAMKQDIADYSEKVLDSFKDIAKQELDILSESVDDNRVRLRFKDNGKYEFRLFVGSDVVVDVSLFHELVVQLIVAENLVDSSPLLLLLL